MSAYSTTEVAYILVELGYSNVKIAGNKVTASCTCSPNKNDHSFGVLVDGGFPGHYCHRCRDKGPLAKLVWLAWANGRKVTKSLLVVMSHEMDMLMGEKPRPELKSLEYAPLADKPRVAHAEPHQKYTTGVQVDLMGRVQIAPPPKPISESDLQRFESGPNAYMTSRGYAPDVQEAFGIRTNTWTRRVVFPIRTWDGELVGWSQRRTHEGDDCWKCGSDIINRKLLLEKGERDLVNRCDKCGTMYAKYMHAAGFKRNKQFYGEWLYKPGVVPVIVEGMTATMNPYRRGLCPPLALPLAIMGGKPGAEQIDRLLQKFPDGPIFVLRDHDDPSLYPMLPDGVGPGDEMAASVRQMISFRDPSRDVVDIVPPPYLDPGDLTDAHVAAVTDVIYGRVIGGSISSIFRL